MSITVDVIASDPIVVDVAVGGTIGEANTGANVGTGSGKIFRDKVGTTLNFKTLTAGTNVTITNDADEIVIDASGGTAPVDSVFGRTGAVTAQALDYLHSQIDDDEIELHRQINDAGNSLTELLSSSEIASRLSGKEDSFVKNSAFNQDFAGTGAATTVARSDHDHDLTYAKLTDPVSTFTNDAGYITAAGAGEDNTSSSAGGTSLVLPKSGVDLPFKGITAGTNITLDVNATDIVINAATGGSGEANTSSNSGAGNGLAQTKVGVDLPFKSLVAGTNVTIDSATDTLTINASGGTAPVDSVFGRTGVVTAQANDYLHSQIDDDEIELHRQINDAGPVSLTELYSSQKIDDLIGAISAAPVDSVFGRTGVVTAQANDYLHSQINDDEIELHRQINDAGTLTTELFSASEIISRLSGKKDDFVENTAFNKSFSGTGSGTDVSRADHNHDLDYANIVHDHVEADVTDLDRVRWKNQWQEVTYLENDMVTDGDWTMIANTTTTDRAAPQPVGPEVPSPTKDTTWNTAQFTGIVRMVHTYTITEAGWGRVLRVRNPFYDTDVFTRITVINLVTGESTIYDDPTLLDDDWTTLGIFNTPLAIGAQLEISFEYYNSSDTNSVDGGWTSTLGAGVPANAAFTIDDLNTPTQIRFDYDDLDATDRQTELDGVSVNSIIHINETGDTSRAIELKVTSVDSADPTSILYGVDVIQNGSKDIRSGVTCTISIDVPISVPSVYNVNTDYWVSNQPSWATVTSKLFYDGVQQADVNDAYGIEVTLQPAEVSPDWDYVTSSSGGSGGIGEPGVTVHAALNGLDADDHVQYALLDGTRDFTEIGMDGGGTLTWNTEDDTLDVDTGIGPVIQVGQESMVKVYNNTGAQINNGQIVSVEGLSSGTVIINKRLTVTLAIATNNLSADGLLVATMDIPNGTEGLATSFGTVRDFDTSAFSLGDTMYLSDTAPGAFTNNRPEFPNYTVPLGVVNNIDVTLGSVIVDITSRITDTFNNFHNGTMRETFNFFVSSDGVTITGSLSPSGSQDDLTMMFSDGFTILDTNPAKTIVLTAGTDSNPQEQFVYIPISTKVLTLSTSGYPNEEHIKIAELLLQSASGVQSEDSYVNQNINDAIQGTMGQGHLSHITRRIRLEGANWFSGTEGSVTIESVPTPDDVFISVTGGVVYQMHAHNFTPIDMALGDHAHIVNHSTTSYLSVTNLNTQTEDANGDTLNNTSFSFVVWGVMNKTGESDQLMVNLPTGSYAFASPNDAINDPNNHSVYSIPRLFKGVGFLISRFTFTYKNDIWTLEDTEDLRGSTPNVSAGGGVGGSGVTTFLGLTDTPSAYASQAGKMVSVNIGETGLEFTDPGASDRVEENINQVLHGFIAGNNIYFDGVDWQLGNSNSPNTFSTHVVGVATDPDNFTAVSLGVISTSGLTSGEWYYSSSTSGVLTVTEPDNSNPVGFALSTTELYVMPMRGSQKSTSGGLTAEWGSISGTLSNQTDLQSELDAKEDDLDNPATDGYILSSTIAGVRSWVSPSGTTYPLQAPDGSAGSPSYSFSSATNMGMFYDPAAGGKLVFSRAGSNQLEVTSNKINSPTLPFSGGLGNAGTPTFNMASSAGMYSKASGQLTLAVSGTAALNIDTSGRITSEISNYETLVTTDITLTNKKYVDDAIDKSVNLNLMLEAASDKTYKFTISSPFAWTINSLVHETASGTLTATVKINTTDVTGLTSVAVNSTKSTSNASGANSVAAGQEVVITVSASATPIDTVFTLKGTMS